MTFRKKFITTTISLVIFLDYLRGSLSRIIPTLEINNNRITRGPIKRSEI